MNTFKGKVLFISRKIMKIFQGKIGIYLKGNNEYI